VKRERRAAVIDVRGVVAKVLPCPFCGSACSCSNWSCAGGDGFAVLCYRKDCDAVGPFALTAREAVDKWNRDAHRPFGRAKPKQPSLGERLRARWPRK
jgi:hypothetical protein